MAQEQYFKAVKVSELPKSDGLYIFLTPDGLISDKMYPFEDGKWPLMLEIRVAKGIYTHYLEPIPIPDAAVLRSALEEVRHHIDTWPDEPERAVRLAAKVIDKALSQTGNEKFHVFTTEELMARDRKMWRQGYAEGEKNK